MTRCVANLALVIQTVRKALTDNGQLQTDLFLISPPISHKQTHTQRFSPPLLHLPDKFIPYVHACSLSILSVLRAMPISFLLFPALPVSHLPYYSLGKNSMVYEHFRQEMQKEYL